MKIETIHSTFLTFVDRHGEVSQVSIGSILEAGTPIDAETGDDLELFTDEITNQ